MGGPWPRPGQPLFTEEDTEAVLEWQRAKDEACPGCGHSRAKTMQKDHHDHYMTRVIRCHACAAADRKRDAYLKQHGSAPGTYFIPVEIE